MRPDLSHLHLNSDNFQPSDTCLCLPLRPEIVRFLPGLVEGGVLCRGIVGAAEADVFYDLNGMTGTTMFVRTTTDVYYHGLQRLGDFKVGDAIKIFMRKGRLVAEKISLDELQPPAAETSAVR